MKAPLTKKQMIIRMIINIVLLLVEVILVINFTFTWVGNNKHAVQENVENFVYYDKIPVYLAVTFNALPPNYDFTKDNAVISKVAVPGDILNMDVFIDMENASYTKVAVTAVGLPSWMQYVGGSALMQYGDKFGDTEEDYEIVIYPDAPCAATVDEVTRTIDPQGDELTFHLTIPSDYKQHANGLNLRFRLYFYDDGTNQNEIIGKNLTIMFKAAAE